MISLCLYDGLRYNNAMRLIWNLLKVAMGLFVLMVPLLGVWLSSSLSVYLNLSRNWVYLFAGLAFPLLPLVWEFWATWRFKKKTQKKLEADLPEPQRILKTFDRLILRTLLINLSILATLLFFYPQNSFVALASQGDWFLPEEDTAFTTKARPVLMAAADRLEWLYNWSKDNPYTLAKKQITPASPLPSAEISEITPASPDLKNDSTATAKPVQKADTRVQENRPQQSKPENIQNPKVQQTQWANNQIRYQQPEMLWPLENTLHPAIARMPKSQEHSIDAVATYIAQNESRPVYRVKAIYDYVTSRIAYDVQSYLVYQNGGDRSFAQQQDAQTVFQSRKGVCAGYARLMQTIAQKMQIPMEYVSGVSRTLGGDLSGSSHAWNAVQLEGKWFLIDATWGAGYVKGNQFTRRYRSTYLFTPPSVFGITHFPEDPAWQLRSTPLTRSEFIRQPALQPDFFAQGFRLLSPQKGHFQAAGDVEVRLQTPPNARLLAQLAAHGEHNGNKCKQYPQGNQMQINCGDPPPGRYQVQIFAAPQQISPGVMTYQYMGQVEFVSS